MTHTTTPLPGPAGFSPREPWLDPDLEPDEFRRLGREAIDMIADWFATMREARIAPAITPGGVARLFDDPLPERGEDPGAILRDWSDRVAPNSTRIGSPRYFGYVMGGSSMIGVLAEALAAATNANVGGWKPAPAATEIERRTIRWIAELLGYPVDGLGLFVSGGTMANVVAVQTALRHVAGAGMLNDGLQGRAGPGRFRLYMADQEAHVSLVRAADLLNLGRDAIRYVKSHADFTLDVDALARVMDEDRARGDVPFCVIGHVGSINVGAVDALDEIADVCAERGAWFHADGACGAPAAMLPELAARFRGIERADSLSLDPHKWLGVPYECGCIIVRDRERLRNAFAINAAYLRGILPTGEEELDYFEYGPQMSRGFRALKVWMTLRQYGAEGCRQLLRQGIECARRADAIVRASEEFESLHAPTIFIYSFRYAPPALRAAAGASAEERKAADARLGVLNQRIADTVRASGRAFVMTSTVGGRTVLRLSICSHRTRPEDIDLTFALMREAGEALSREA